LAFRKISIHAELIDRVERLLRQNKGYRSIAEFISEAVRLRIEEVENRRAEVAAHG
jgi:metal-responsive CopG/Arc/MetJ family transcriptional regulator